MAPSEPAVLNRNSVQVDAVGDCRDGNDRKLAQVPPGTDLVSVKLTATESQVEVTFKASTNFPVTMPSDKHAVWSVCAGPHDGNGGCILGAKIIGSSTRRPEWLAYCFDVGTTRNVYVKEPVIEGKELVVTFPRDQLPDWFSKPFKWWATTEWDGSEIDRTPDHGETSNDVGATVTKF